MTRTNYTKRLLPLVVAALTLMPGVAFAQGALTNGGNHEAAISIVGEIDTWTFTAALGDSISLSIGEKVLPGPDPGLTPWIRLQRPDGVQIGSAVAALATGIQVTAPLSGTYTVLVADYYGTKTGNYILHLLKAPGTFVVPAGDEGGPMTNGANHVGRIGGVAGQPIEQDPGDEDPWTFTASKADYLSISIGEVLTSEIDPGFTPYIRLIGPTGTALGASTGALAGRIDVDAPLTGTYTVIVADYYGNKTGDYVLHLTKAPGTLIVPTGDEGGPMTSGANHVGRIGALASLDIKLDPGDEDPWTFTAGKDDYLSVSIGEVVTSEIDPGFTPYIRLIGPNGTLLGSSTGALGARIDVVAPLTGTYTVIVADYYGTKTGDYILHLIRTPGTNVVPAGDEGGPMTPGATHEGRIGALAGLDIALDPGDQDPWTFVANQSQALSVSIGEVLIGETDPGFTPYIRLIGPAGAFVGAGTGGLAAQINVVAPLTGVYTVIVSDYYGNATGNYTLRCTGCQDPTATLTVTPSVVGSGTISPNTPQQVAPGQTRAFNLQPAASSYVSSVTGTCGGNLVGLVFTTNPVAANCTVVANFAPRTMALDKTALIFGAVTSGSSFVYQTPSQVVRLTQTGPGAVSWTAAPSQPWLQVTPSSGTGSANLSVAIVPIPGLPANGTAGASVTFTFTGATNNPGPINVALKLEPIGAVPIGTVDTPTNNRTGVTGAVPFTGWAVDDVGVSRVSVCRSAFGAEVAPVDPNCGGAAQFFVGFAVLIDGARPDVAAAYPAYPANTIAGWGFMVLTNMLPNQGNGTYVFHMYAQDVDGHSTLLGSRTMTCANTAATLPFGAIDTPTQGGVASGTAFVNFGWALTPLPKTIPISGSTITVLVDGLSQGTVGYNYFRSDIATLFPGLNNTQGAIGFKVLDTTAFANGTHTIVWVVTDDQGATEGIGSRFFTVSNGAGSLTAAASEGVTAVPLPADVAALPSAQAPVLGRRGFDLGAPFTSYAPGGSGRVLVRGEELDRFELALGGQPGVRYTGYLRAGADLAPLPIGSTLDPSTGVFTWAPGVGFVGSYDLVFVRSVGSAAIDRQEVRIVLQPKGRGAVGPQVVIDVPASQRDVAQPFMLAGWAADLDAETGTGISSLHVWAYPLAGGPPVFVGATDTGGHRPDVVAAYGEQFLASGYGLVVNGLEPGNYDLAVFGYSTVSGGFVPARVVRVTVR